MNLFRKVNDILEEIKYDCYMEVYDCEWSFMDEEEEEVYWYSEGIAYSSELTEGIKEQDDTVFVNTDNGCGETITRVFAKYNYVPWVEFVDRYEDQV